MRYPSDGEINTAAAYGDSMHAMLRLSMVMAIVIGLVLLALAFRGRILWMKVWSLGLVVSALAYLALDFSGRL